MELVPSITQEEMIEELIRYIELDLPDKRMFRIPEVAKYFNVNDRTIRMWMKDRKIKYEKIGGSIRISRQAILDFRLKGSYVPNI